jgi:hypothetical protein
MILKSYKSIGACSKSFQGYEECSCNKNQYSEVSLSINFFGTISTKHARTDYYSLKWPVSIIDSFLQGIADVSAQNVNRKFVPCTSTGLVDSINGSA